MLVKYYFQSNLIFEINNIDSTMNFSNKNKFDYIYSDALFLNADNERLKKIEKNTSTNYLKQEVNFLNGYLQIIY